MGVALKSPFAPITFREVAEGYARFFFDYTDSPLLIVNASEIDFVANDDDRRARIEVVVNTRAGVNHWSRS